MTTPITSAAAPADDADRAQRRAQSRRGLLLSLRPDGGAFAEWARDHAAAADWEWLLRRAQQHKLAALLAARLADCDLDVDVRQRLAIIRLEATQRAAAAERTLACLADAFAAPALPFFVVKGSVLAHQIYGDPRLRRFADVDIVVRQADVPRAEEALRGLGFRPGGFEAIVAARPTTTAERRIAKRLARRFEARHLGAFSWYAPAGGEMLSVDLHWQLSPTRLPGDEDRLWQQTTPVTVAGTRLLTLTPAATVLHLAAHATTCLLNGFRLLHLADVGWAARHFADQGAAVWALAEQWGVTAHLGLVFALVEQRLGIEVEMAGGASGRRPTKRRLASEAMLVDVPDLATMPQHKRLGPELRWAVAMGCVRRNVRVSTAAAAARARFRLHRWRLPRAD